MAIVEQLAEQIRQRFAVASDRASLAEIAEMLHSGVDLVVICRPDKTPFGIVTKTNIVEHVAKQRVISPETCLAPWVMITDIVTCCLSDRVDAAWATMRSHGLRNLPVTDIDGRVVGVLNARDALQALLIETENEEELLREYVMGRGYR